MVYRLSQSYSPTPYLIREYIYCPMIPWIITHYNIVEPLTTSMEEGLVDTGYREDVIEDTLGYVDSICYEKQYVLDNGSSIVVDAIARKGRENIIVEIKRFKNKYYRHQIAQLKAYSYLLTRHGEPVHQVVLIQDKRVVYKKRIEDIDLEAIESIIEELERVIESDKPPRVYKTRKCNSCWYRRLCPLWG